MARGGIAGLWELTLPAMLFLSMPSFPLASQANTECPSVGLLSHRHVVAGQIVPLLALDFPLVVDTGFTPRDVDLLCDRFQVRWVEAGAVSAQVVNLHPFWDGTTKMREGKTVGVESFGSFVDTQGGNAVSARFGTGPNPALVVSPDVLSEPVVEVLAGIHATRV